MAGPLGEGPLSPTPPVPVLPGPVPVPPADDRITVPYAACGCGVLDGDVCDCAGLLVELRRAPVIHFTAGRAAA